MHLNFFLKSFINYSELWKFSGFESGSSDLKLSQLSKTKGNLVEFVVFWLQFFQFSVFGDT